MTLAPVGTCFGFELRADHPLPLLRGGSGTPLDISVKKRQVRDPGVLIYQWHPDEKNPIDARLHSAPRTSGYDLWVNGAGWYSVVPGAITSPTSLESLEGVIRLLGLPMLLSCLTRGDTTLHAAALEVDGKALLLAGPGRHGKTSLAASLTAQGLRLLSEDLCALQFRDDAAYLTPGPNGIRVRPDMAPFLNLAEFRAIGEYGDRQVMVPTQPPGDCTPLPVLGTVLLGDFGHHLELSAIDVAEAIRDLWFLSFHFPNDPDRARKFQALVDLATTTVTWRLNRPENRAGLPAMAAAVLESARSEA